ncbi:MAG: 1,4-alpha-glucan branching protein GlgB [Eubacteriales bacterium]|nr:1,4-alpha-glucan branching protein GlgB [Eubacteriales bacterium]
MDLYNFYTGKEFEAYEFLGAHVFDEGVTFRTFAPAASRISVIGEFNGWTETPMNRICDGNFWECTIYGAVQGQMYKYRIYGNNGTCRDHGDPFAFYSEVRPGTASVIWGREGYSFTDEKWMSQKKDAYHQPVNIYEMHFGSWKKKDQGYGPESWYSYEELAEELIPYLKEQGYNYLEIMPLCEYPCDESWGYQGTGYFSPTSRYGTPEELKCFIDQCHKADIGVILDFVPVHFAVNDYALANYDGTALFEYPHIDVGRNEWGSCNFMHSRGEVCSFLQSCALYWLKEFHFDGLRMDAVGNLIYWQGDKGRGENVAALKFLRVMNQGLKERFPQALLFAEDSTPYPGVTRPVSQGGLGFDYKWDLGWMHDTLSYFQSNTQERRERYHQLTFSMMYFYNEKYILPLSHDEVVHGKATIAQKMNGDYEGKFPQARAFYLYMYAHPGAKLNFMGNELAQLKEWGEKNELDWMLLDFPIHESFHRFMKDLNRCYLEDPALWAMEYEEGGFSWIDCHQEEKCIYAFYRRGGGQTILAVFNFSEEEQIYDLKMEEGEYRLLIASDQTIYGGEKDYGKQEQRIQGKSASLTLSPFSGRYYVKE